MFKRIRRISVVYLCVMLSCGWGANRDGGGCDPIQATPAELVAQAKLDLADQDYHSAREQCLAAERADDTYAEAKYCVLLASLGALIQSTHSLLGLGASQLAPAAFQTKAIDLKSLVGSMLSDVEDHLRYIDRYTYKLARFHHPSIAVADFPIDLVGPFIYPTVAPIEHNRLRVNLKGTWDKSEVMLLAVAVNAVQAVLDYLLAHELVFVNTDFDLDSTAGIARMLISNPGLLTKDESEWERIKGGNKHDGLRKDILAALSYAVGRDDDVARVAPRNNGLAGAIKLSASSGVTDAVLIWSDDDGDGVPDAVMAPFLDDIKDELVDEGGEPLFHSSKLESPFREATWRRLTGLALALRDNIEGASRQPVPLVNTLQAVADDLRVQGSKLRLVLRGVPDVVAINPDAFLDEPAFLAELMPYQFTYMLAATTAEFADLAVEFEVFEATTGEWLVMKSGREAYRGLGDDFEHFLYNTPDHYAPEVTVVAYDLAVFSYIPELEADGISADEKSPVLISVALQDPSFGGLLAGDPSGTGNHRRFDSARLNEALARLVKYYCLDFSLGILEALDDDYYDAGNKITTCTGGF